ncbi:MAG: AMP-binding protein [Gemmatimonadales bacterium]
MKTDDQRSVSQMHDHLRAPSEERRRRYEKLGLWHEQSLGAFVDEQLRANAGSEVRFWADDGYVGTAAEIRERARRFAGGLVAAGVEPGDVVSYQLPNRVEALVVLYGAAMAGAVLVPIVHFYGPKELTFILEQSGSVLHVTAATQGGMDSGALEARVRTALSSPPHFVVVGGAAAGQTEFEALEAAAALDVLPTRSADAPALVAYTSGTTADPKGVIHVSRSFLAELHQLVAYDAGGRRPLLTGAPLAHAMGMLGGAFLPLLQRKAIHFIDAWDPGRVLDAVLEADVSAGFGSTYFLTSLLDHPSFGPEHARRMERVGLGGAPVPAAVCQRADRLGISTVRSYGSTEHMTIAGGRHDDPADKRMRTDGRPLLGCEIRLLDPDGDPVPAGVPGEIWSRGPDLFWGYTDPELTAASIDADGWYRTEAVGILDEDGFLSITDRVKDIIIRGGENLSAAEIEEELVRMEGVLEVAVVAAPDERLGEHACAVFRMRPDTAAPSMHQVQAHLGQAGLAKQKWPEEIREVQDFPRTPTGKIKKVDLRENVSQPAE